MGLVSALKIRPGITAVIGSGGKTTLLRVLGEELAHTHTVLLCTTTKIMPVPGIPCALTGEELERLREKTPLLCAGTLLPECGKLTAPEWSMERLGMCFDYVLVEADGAARKPLKAHAPHEPVIPPEAGEVICVVGATGFDRPICEVAHRPERFAQLAGVGLEAAATVETVAAVLTAEHLCDRIYVNQVETEAARLAAQRLAKFVECPLLAGSLWKEREHLCAF